MRNKIITAFFCLLLAVAALAGLIMPDRYYSEREKRTLTQKPQFTIADFISGRFSDNLESYLTDQDPLRDGWVTMKTYLDLAVGKKESGGVYICKDKYLMDKFISYSKKQLAANAASLADLQEKLAAEGISMQTILVPMAAQVLTDKLPAYAPVADYAAILQVLTDSGVDTTDVFSVLAAHSSENIYYRTDHHWTSLGAYYAYSQLCQTLTMPAAHGAASSRTRMSGRRKFSAIISTVRLGIKFRCPPSPPRRSPHGTNTQTAMLPITTVNMRRTASMSDSILAAMTSMRCF